MHVLLFILVAIAENLFNYLITNPTYSYGVEFQKQDNNVYTKRSKLILIRSLSILFTQNVYFDISVLKQFKYMSQAPDGKYFSHNNVRCLWFMYIS